MVVMVVVVCLKGRMWEMVVMVMGGVGVMVEVLMLVDGCNGERLLVALKSLIGDTVAV